MPEYRLLYVEDNPVNALVVEELLARRPDVQLQVQATGSAGLACAAQWKPHLVLVDHHLPDMDGQAVLAKLRRLLPGVPCVSLSASADLPPGFDECWSKPIDFPKFWAGIDRFLTPPNPAL
jgi:CheY-like chemotaxis protein